MQIPSVLCWKLKQRGLYMKNWKENNVIRFVFQYEKESCICYMIITTFFIACFWCFKDIYILLWKLVTTITLFKVILSFVCAWWLTYIVFKIVVFSRFCDIPLGEKIDKNKFDTLGNYIDFIENIQKPRYRIFRCIYDEYPEFPKKLREEIFNCIAENYTELEIFEYLQHYDNVWKWEKIFHLKMDLLSFSRKQLLENEEGIYMGSDYKPCIHYTRFNGEDKKTIVLHYTMHYIKEGQYIKKISQ